MLRNEIALTPAPLPEYQARGAKSDMCAAHRRAAGFPRSGERRHEDAVSSEKEMCAVRKKRTETGTGPIE